MNKRIISSIVCLLYLSIVAAFGVIHHHAPVGSIHDAHQCLACDWHVAGMTDVPVVDSPIISAPIIESPVLIPQSVLVPNIYLSLFFSRGPPVVSA